MNSQAVVLKGIKLIKISQMIKVKMRVLTIAKIVNKKIKEKRKQKEKCKKS
jgi:hypothetical protein